MRLTIGIIVVGHAIPLAEPLLGLPLSVCWIASGVALAVGGAVVLRAYGAQRWGLALQVILITGYLLSFIVRYDDPQPPLIGSIIGAPCSLGLFAVLIMPDRVARLLARRPEWEVLHRLSAVSAMRAPLSRDEALREAPGILAMLEGAMRFRTAATTEYLDLFIELARADLAVRPVPADPAALDARWHELHRMLAAQFGPFAQWQIQALALGSEPLTAR